MNSLVPYITNGCVFHPSSEAEGYGTMYRVPVVTPDQKVDESFQRIIQNSHTPGADGAVNTNCRNETPFAKESDFKSVESPKKERLDIKETYALTGKITKVTHYPVEKRSPEHFFPSINGGNSNHPRTSFLGRIQGDRYIITQSYDAACEEDFELNFDKSTSFIPLSNAMNNSSTTTQIATPFRSGSSRSNNSSSTTPNLPFRSESGSRASSSTPHTLSRNASTGRLGSVGRAMLDDNRPSFGSRAAVSKIDGSLTPTNQPNTWIAPIVHSESGSAINNLSTNKKT